MSRTKHLGLLTAAVVLSLGGWTSIASADDGEDSEVEAAQSDAEAAEEAAEAAKEQQRIEMRERKLARKAEERARKAELQRRMEAGEIEGRVRSPAMLAIGPILIVGGIAGSTAFAIAAANVTDDGGLFDFSDFNRALLIIGAVASAGVGLGVGVPLVALGSKKVPVDDHAPAKASAVPNVTVGAGSVTAQWTF